MAFVIGDKLNIDWFRGWLSDHTHTELYYVTTHSYNDLNASLA